jgi:chaperonin GroES
LISQGLDRLFIFSKIKINTQKQIIINYFQQIAMAKKFNIAPLGDRVLIEALSEEERVKKTKSGIVIPETADKEKVDRGRVVAVGPGKITEDGKKIPVSVKKGQIVIFSEYSADKIKVDDKEYYIISENNILAIIE